MLADINYGFRKNESHFVKSVCTWPFTLYLEFNLCRDGWKPIRRHFGKFWKGGALKIWLAIIQAFFHEDIWDPSLLYVTLIFTWKNK